MLDISYMTFDADFFERMKPKMERILAMAELGAAPSPIQMKANGLSLLAARAAVRTNGRDQQRD
jgi:hypothetical protein